MTSPYETQLEELLSREPAALVQAQQARFRRLTEQFPNRLVLFGAGALGRFTLAGLRQSGIEPLAFADNNPALWNTLVEGAQVLAPKAAAERFAANALFVITIYTGAPVWEQLTTLGVRAASFATLAWQYPSTLTPHGGVTLPQQVFAHANEIKQALGLWADEASRAEYVAQLRWRCQLESSVLPPHLPQREIYFADDLIARRAEEVFVDCGAFDGDSVAEFLRRYGASKVEVVAIEPDPANCNRLRERLGSFSPDLRKEVHVIQSAVGAARGVLPFNATGTAGSSIGHGDYYIESAPLDELVADFSPTYVKMDIEGSEPDALHGATDLIRRHQPVLAVCLYHRHEHLWQIPLLIHSLEREYDLFLRRYSDECWELVCYAVPRGRSRLRSERGTAQ